MLQSIRVLNIQSNLESIVPQKGIVFSTRIITRAERGDKLLDKGGCISVFFELKLIFSIGQQVDSQEQEEESESIGSPITLKAQCLFDDTKSPEENWSEEELDQFSGKVIPEIYPHLYQKLRQIFDIHELRPPALPLSYNQEEFTSRVGTD